jgi:hypothetical protein
MVMMKGIDARRLWLRSELRVFGVLNRLGGKGQLCYMRDCQDPSKAKETEEYFNE